MLKTSSAPIIKHLSVKANTQNPDSMDPSSMPAASPTPFQKQMMLKTFKGQGAVKPDAAREDKNLIVP